MATPIDDNAADGNLDKRNIWLISVGHTRDLEAALQKVDGKFKENAIWNSFGSTAYLASQWFMTILVTRFFGYGDAGVISLAMSITASFQTIALFGIRNFQVSDIEDKYPDSCYVMLRGMTCLTALAACMVFTLLNRYSPAQAWVVFLFMLFRLSEDYSDVFQGIAQKKGRLDLSGKGLALKGILILSAMIMGHLLGARLNACLAMMAASSWMVTLFFDLKAAKKICRFSLAYSIKASLALCREAIPLCIYLFLSSTVTVVPKYILEKLCGNVILGAYSSISAPLLIIHVSAVYIYAPFISNFAELFKEKRHAEFILLAAKIMLAFAAIGIICIAAAIIAGDWTLELIYGESILEYSSMLLPSVMAMICVAISSFAYMLEVVVRDFKNLIIGCSIGFVCASGFSPAMIAVFGADGASIGIIISAAGSVLYMMASLAAGLRKSKNLLTTEEDCKND